MTTSFLLRLIQDGALLNLNAAPYTTDFTPPDAETTAMSAQGTSANRYGGASLAGERANNRSSHQHVYSNNVGYPCRVPSIYGQFSLETMD